MAMNASEIVVAGTGRTYAAPVGTTAPTSPTGAVGASWLDLGLINDDGATFTDGKTLEPVTSWQLFYASRRIVTAREAYINFALQQWNADTVPLAFGGGEVTGSEGAYRYEPPEPGTVDERAMLLEWTDGDKHYRLVIPRGMVTDNVEAQYTKSAPAELPIRFDVMGTEGQAPWYLITDDPAFAGAA
jgi:hypothetical protein